MNFFFLKTFLNSAGNQKSNQESTIELSLFLNKIYKDYFAAYMSWQWTEETIVLCAEMSDNVQLYGRHRIILKLEDESEFNSIESFFDDMEAEAEVGRMVDLTMTVTEIIKLDNQTAIKISNRGKMFYCRFSNDGDGMINRYTIGSIHQVDEAIIRRISLQQRPQYDPSFEQLLTDEFISGYSNTNNDFIGYSVDSTVMALMRTLFVLVDGFPYKTSADVLAALEGDTRTFCAYLSQAIRTLDNTNYVNTMGQAKLEESILIYGKKVVSSKFTMNEVVFNELEPLTEGECKLFWNEAVFFGKGLEKASRMSGVKLVRIENDPNTNVVVRCREVPTLLCDNCKSLLTMKATKETTDINLASTLFLRCDKIFGYRDGQTVKCSFNIYPAYSSEKLMTKLSNPDKSQHPMLVKRGVAFERPY